MDPSLHRLRAVRDETELAVAVARVALALLRSRGCCAAACRTHDRDVLADLKQVPVPFPAMREVLLYWLKATLKNGKLLKRSELERLPAGPFRLQAISRYYTHAGRYACEPDAVFFSQVEKLLRMPEACVRAEMTCRQEKSDTAKALVEGCEAKQEALMLTGRVSELEKHRACDAKRMMTVEADVHKTKVKQEALERQFQELQAHASTANAETAALAASAETAANAAVSVAATAVTVAAEVHGAFAAKEKAKRARREQEEQDEEGLVKRARRLSLASASTADD